MDTRQNYGVPLMNYFMATLTGFFLMLWLGKQGMSQQAPAEILLEANICA